MVQLLPESFRTREGQNGRLSTILKHGSWLKGRVDFHFLSSCYCCQPAKAKAAHEDGSSFGVPQIWWVGQLGVTWLELAKGWTRGDMHRCNAWNYREKRLWGDKESITLVTLFGGNQPPWWGHLPQFFFFWKTKLKYRISSDEDQNLLCHAPSVLLIISFNLSLLIIHRLWKNLKRK